MAHVEQADEMGIIQRIDHGHIAMFRKRGIHDAAHIRIGMDWKDHRDIGPGRNLGNGGSDIFHAASEILPPVRSEEHTSELQSLMRISYAVLVLKNKNP